MYRFLFTIVFFGKMKNNTHQTFHILKMKAHFEKEPHFGNESSYWNPFWKWKHILSSFNFDCWYLWKSNLMIYEEYFFSFTTVHHSAHSKTRHALIGTCKKSSERKNHFASIKKSFGQKTFFLFIQRKENFSSIEKCHFMAFKKFQPWLFRESAETLTTYKDIFYFSSIRVLKITTKHFSCL